MAVAGDGEFCSYCQRELIAYSVTHPTRDHVTPRSRGGTKTVWACMVCNSMKRDLLPNQWQEFMSTNPRWWEKAKKRGPNRSVQLRGSVPPVPRLVLRGGYWVEK